jgi:hypothetical protein
MTSRCCCVLINRGWCHRGGRCWLEALARRSRRRWRTSSSERHLFGVVCTAHQQRRGACAMLGNARQGQSRVINQLQDCIQSLFLLLVCSPLFDRCCFTSSFRSLASSTRILEAPLRYLSFAAGTFGAVTALAALLPSTLCLLQ